MRHDLFVIGVGPGAPEQLTLAARKTIDSAAFVVAAPRHRHLAPKHACVIELGKFEETFELLDVALDTGSAAVLVSGDTGVFSLLPLLKKRFSNDKICVIPGISSLQSLSASCLQTWIDAVIISGHGRMLTEAKLLDTADQNAKTIFFCGPDWKPERVCQTLADAGMNNLHLTVGERLSYEDEQISCGTPQELAVKNYDSLSLVLIENPKPWQPPHARPRDDDFIRADIPMTRETVRSAILDALRLSPNSVVWDLGAGTGSVTVAAALECPNGSVFAVEKNHEAVKLIRANCAKFHRHNVTVIAGDNQAALPSLPGPTHVFIGGSGAELPHLLEQIAALGSGIHVVLSAVAMKTHAAAYEVMSGSHFSDFDAVQVAVSRLKKVGSTSIMAAQNPVTVFSAITSSKEGGSS